MAVSVTLDVVEPPVEQEDAQTQHQFCNGVDQNTSPPAPPVEVEITNDVVETSGPDPVVLDPLANDALPEDATLEIPVPQALDNGTVVYDEATCTYSFIPDEGAVGEATVVYRVTSADGSTLGGGIITITANNPLSLEGSVPNGVVLTQQNLSATGADGLPVRFSSEPSVTNNDDDRAGAVEDFTDELAIELAPPREMLNDGTSSNTYEEVEGSRQVVTNPDGSTTITYTYAEMHWAYGAQPVPTGNSVTRTTTITNDGTSTTPVLTDNPTLDAIPVVHAPNTYTATLPNGDEVTFTTDPTVEGQEGGVEDFADEIATQVQPADTNAAGTSDRPDASDAGSFEMHDDTTNLTYEEDTAAREYTTNPDGTITVRYTFIETNTVDQQNPQTTLVYREVTITPNPANGGGVDIPAGNPPESYAVTHINGVPADDVVTLDSGATVQQNENGTINYTPAIGQTGGDTFTVTIGGGRDAIQSDNGAPATRDRVVTIDALGRVTYSDLPAARRDTVLLTQDTETEGGTQITMPFDPLRNDEGAGPLEIVEVEVISGGTVLEAEIVDGQLVFTAPVGQSGDFVVSYTVRDANGATSQSFVDVHVSEFTEAQLIEKQFASGKLGEIAGKDYPDLEIIDNENGTYTFKVPSEGLEFTVDATEFAVPPTFISEMITQFAVIGAAQAHEQFNDPNKQHFDLDDPQEKAMYEMFLRVGAALGMHTDSLGGELFNGLLDEEAIFTEMGEILFGTSVGKDWVVGNMDTAVSSLSGLDENDDFTGATAEELFDRMLTMFTGEDPDPLTLSDGTEMSESEKDVIMSILLGQIGFLGSNLDTRDPEMAVDAGVDALVDYATDIYAPEAAQELAEDLNELELEVDISALFGGATEEQIQHAINTGDYSALGMTDEDFLEAVGVFLFTAAKVGLQIRTVIEMPGEFTGLLGAFGNMFKDTPVPPTEAEVRLFVDEVVMDMETRMRAQPAGTGPEARMNMLYASMGEVSDRKGDTFAKFKGASDSIKSYSSVASGTRGAGGLSDPLGGFTTILVLGTAGLSGQGFWTSGDPVEITAVAGWASLLVTGGTSSVISLLGPVTKNLTDVNPNLRALNNMVANVEDWSLNTPGQGHQGYRARGVITNVLDDLTDDIDSVATLMNKPAVQSFFSVRGGLAALGAVAAPVGTALLGTSLALSAHQETDAGLKAAKAATSALWFSSSAGFAVVGAQAIAKSLGVSIGSLGAKIGAVAAKVANVTARLTALAFFVIGALQGAQAQEKFTKLWDTMMGTGGPDDTEGHFVKENFRDLQPSSVAGMAFANGLLAAIGGGPAVVGFDAHPDLADRPLSEEEELARENLGIAGLI